VVSVKVANVEADLMAALATVTDLADQVVWAVDIVGAPSALILALLARAGSPVFYASGRVVNTMSAAYTGEGKTDAKDAYVIAETVRLRRDLPMVDAVTDLIRELALLTAHRSDLIADRVRMINRLRDVMTSVFPTLEQQFDYSSHKGALILLTEYASPKRLRRLGETRLTQWLRRRQVRDAARVAARALAAARGQDIELPGQQVAEMIIAELAGSLLHLDQRIQGLDQQIAATFRRHHQAITIESMPGFGPILGAQLLVAAGDVRAYPSAGHLAAAAGLVPVPNDSGRRSGNLHKPRRYSRPLRHVFYLSAQTSMMRGGSQPCLLPQETRWRSHPRPSRHHPRPPPHRRPLGPPTRRPHLQHRPAHPRCRGLTTSLRFPVTGHGPVLGLGRSLGNVDHVRDPVLALADLPRRPTDRPTGT